MAAVLSDNTDHSAPLMLVAVSGRSFQVDDIPITSMIVIGAFYACCSFLPSRPGGALI